MPNEEWRPIERCRGLYEVSNLGRIRRTSDGKLLSTSKPEKIDGYCSVHFGTADGCSVKRVHRIVAEAFLERPDRPMHVHHKNGNRADNRAENLEWADPHEHGATDADRRRKQGVKTKAHENWLARKNAGFEKLAPSVP